MFVNSSIDLQLLLVSWPPSPRKHCSLLVATGFAAGEERRGGWSPEDAGGIPRWRQRGEDPPPDEPEACGFGRLGTAASWRGTIRGRYGKIPGSGRWLRQVETILVPMPSNEISLISMVSLGDLHHPNKRWARIYPPSECVQIPGLACLQRLHGADDEVQFCRMAWTHRSSCLLTMLIVSLPSTSVRGDISCFTVAWCKFDVGQLPVPRWQAA